MHVAVPLFMFYVYFNFLLSGDEYVNVNSSGSTISEVNSLQSVSTIEEVELIEGKPMSVDSGIDSRNILCSENNICDSNRKKINSDLSVDEEPFQCDLIVDDINEDDIIHIDKHMIDFNKNNIKNLDCGSDNVFNSPVAHSPVSLSERSKSKDTELVGFSPHLQTSTPKTDDENKQSFTNEIPEKKYLDFKEVWSSYENGNDTNLLHEKENEQTNSSSHIDELIDFQCIREIDKMSRNVIDGAGNSDFTNFNEPMHCLKKGEEKVNINNKDFSEYAIRTSEYGSLGSPLSEIEFHNNDNDHIEILVNEHVNIPDVSQDIMYNNLVKSGKISNREKTNQGLENDVESSEDISIRNTKIKTDPKINNFMSDLNINDQARGSHVKSKKESSHQLQKCAANLKLSPRKEKTSKIVQGFYYGQAKHKDGSLLPVLFEVSR